MSDAIEVSFDGLVGPTHHYGGLGPGNLASARHRSQASNPRAAALQGLAKMRLLMELGARQGVLPPHERPSIAALRRLGFEGGDAQVLERARRDAPELLSACASASAMWAANAATVSPAADTSDGRVHFTPANFPTELHRALEPPTTAAVLRKIFRDPARFAHHEPLPACGWLADEGAANHLRLAERHGEPGVEVFVYGRAAREEAPRRFPARQTLEAAEAVARLHGARRALFVRQSPAAIDAGAFHNDVVAVANECVLFHHETAFAGGEADVARIAEALQANLEVVTIPARELSLETAVDCYLFNSQLVTLPSGEMALLCPEECRAVPAAWSAVERLAASTSIREVRTVAVRQSMQNGGGPACLRLRVVLRREELAAVHPGVLLDAALLARLTAWAERHYRERLHADDLADPRLLDESRTALDELTAMLDLGSIYPFQC
jgi:succinylarginine dihydrolase